MKINKKAPWYVSEKEPTKTKVLSCKGCVHLTVYSDCGHPGIRTVTGTEHLRYAGTECKSRRPSWCPLGEDLLPFVKVDASDVIDMSGTALTPEVFEEVRKQVNSWKFSPGNGNWFPKKDEE